MRKLAAQADVLIEYFRPGAMEGWGLGPQVLQAAAKQEAMRAFREQYAALRLTWGGYAAYDPWVAAANNASFGAQAAYDDLVPAFEALFERGGRNWPAFYDAVRLLAQLPASNRMQALKQTTLAGKNGG